MSDSSQIAKDSAEKSSDGRVDGPVALIAVASTVILIGMLANIPLLIFCIAPVIIGLLLFLSITKRGKAPVKITIAIAIYTIVLVVLFAVMFFGQASSHTFGGLPFSTAVLLYIAWPFTSISAGLLYSWVYVSWLSPEHDLVDEHGREGKLG